MESEKIEVKIFLSALAAVVLVELITSKVIVLDRYFLIQGAARLLDVILILSIVVLWGRGLASVGLEPAKLFNGVKRGALWSAGFGIVTAICFAALYAANINPFSLVGTTLPSNGPETVFFFLVAGILGPVAEELFFRGVIYGYFRRWGVLAAILFSTSVFVLLHSTHGIPITQIVGGIVFSIAYEIEKNLMVPITIHILGNAAIFTLSMVPA